MTDAAYDQTAIARVLPFTAGAGSGVGRLQKAASAKENVTAHLSESDLAKIGADVVQDWTRDKASNKDWRERAEEALDAASQETTEPKDYPFEGAANVQYPLLTISGIQFNARAYPAIVKGDEAVKVKTFGSDKSGKKAKRAQRVAEFLNFKLFYCVEGWEADTDAMLLRLPIVGQHYRKVYYDPINRKPCIESVSALRLTIPSDARTLKSSPRITHDFDLYPYEVQQFQAAGHYRKVVLGEAAPRPMEGDAKPQPEAPTDEQAARLMLEQHRMMDLDEDGLDEPYIVTVDHGTSQVLRIEEAFGDEDVQYGETADDGSPGDIVKIERWCPFVDYGFIPDPKGRAYATGFGHLLAPIMDAVNTAINMMLDAGHAQVAGGGFIGAELRLQGAGQNGVLRFQPGEYKNVMATGDDIRKAIYERTFPEPSAVLFQLLGMLMEAAKDVASVNDAITGDAARTAPVGTTLALIEQGQQVFNAIYKRIYRGLREEFKLFAECVAKYGDPAEYAKFCDEDDDQPMMGHNGGPPLMGQDPQAAQPGLMPADPSQAPMQGAPEVSPQPQAAPVPVDPAELFKADFDMSDLDIRPVSDPSAVTKAQMMAKDQFALAFLGKGIYADDRAVVRQALQDAGIEHADEWIPEQAPPPNPLAIHEMAQKAQLTDAHIKKLSAGAVLDTTKAAEIAHNNTGAQSDAAVALEHAKAAHLLAGAAATAGGLLPELINPNAEPQPTATPAAPASP